MKYQIPMEATIPASEVQPSPETDTENKIIDEEVIKSLRTWHGGLYRVNMVARDQRDEPFIIGTLIGYAN